MLSGVAECIGHFDLLDPAPSHPTLFKEWREAVEDQLDEIAGEEVVGSAASATVACFEGLDIFLQRARAVTWSQQPTESRRAHALRLLTLPQIPQRTPGWYAQGKRVLTASEFSTIFKTPRAISQLVLAKSPAAAVAPSTAISVTPVTAIANTNRLACMTCEMGPFDWGIRFEPVVKQVLEKRWGANIAESGRLVHPTDNRLAASPDGILVDAADPARVGRLVEIKCPISREIGGDIPFEYWCQMQLQMEVTDIDECEYVEVKIDSITKQKAEFSGQAEGHVWLLQKPEGACEMMYAYTEAEKDALESAGNDLIESIPWRVTRLETKVVVRDRAWFESTAGARESFWEKVAASTAGTFTPAPSSRKPKAKVGTGGLVLNIIKEGAEGLAASPVLAAPVDTSCLIADD